jgi:hypothetical protein
MKSPINQSRTFYAAIQSRCSDGQVERFVISYTSEEALRELLAAPSIVVSGCTTRERAEELCRGEAQRAIEINDEFRSHILRCGGVEPRTINASRHRAFATRNRRLARGLRHHSTGSSSSAGISSRRKPRQRNSDPPSR